MKIRLLYRLIKSDEYSFYRCDKEDLYNQYLSLNSGVRNYLGLGTFIGHAGKILGIGCVGLLQFVLWVLLTFGLVASAQCILFPEPYIPTQLPELAETLGAASVTSKIVTPEISMDYAVNLFQTLDGVNWVVMLSAFVFFFIFGYLLYAAIFAVSD